MRSGIRTWAAKVAVPSLPVVAVLCLATLVAAASQQGPAVPHAVNRTLLDTTCSPCKDFYRFANGAWLDTVKFPPGVDEWGQLRALQFRNTALVSALLDSIAISPARHANTPLSRKTGAYYRACIANAPDSVGVAALAPIVRRIDAVRTPAQLAEVVGSLQRYQVPAFVELSIGSTEQDLEHNYAQLGDDSRVWALPRKSLYLRDDSASARVRRNYAASLTTIFQLLGDGPDSAAASATRVVRVETALARLQPPDDGSAASPRSMADLQRASRAFDWRAFARGLGRPALAGIVIGSTRFVPVIDSLAAAIPVTDWRAYLKWSLARVVASSIPGIVRIQNAFLAENFDRTPPSRPVTCALETGQQFSEGVSEIFVAKVFPRSARAAATALAETIRGELRRHVAQADWLGAASRNAWIARLDSTKLWIGYANPRPAYEGLEVRDGQPTANLLAARRYAMDRQVAAIGSRVDRDDWTDEDVSVADGYYRNEVHALAITAGELAGPFFDPRAEPAFNFGKIGQVMGHELTHALHSRVKLAGEAGPRADAWTAAEVSEFTRRARWLVQQYDSAFINDSIHVNGRRTLSENIADIGGIALAWAAFQHATAGKPREVIDGFTPDQRFFIAYAQSINTAIWSEREVATQSLVDGYSHSYPKLRINGALMNFAPFAVAFGCKEGNPMVRPAAVRWAVW